MDQKPANQIHDESTTTAQEPVGSLAQANTVSVGQGQLAGGYKTHVRDDTSGGSGSYIPDEVSGWCWGGFSGAGYGRYLIVRGLGYLD